MSARVNADREAVVGRSDALEVGRQRGFVVRSLFACLAALTMEGFNSLLTRFTVVTLEPLPAMAFLSGALFGRAGILGLLVGQVLFRVALHFSSLFTEGLDLLYPILRLPLSYAPIAFAGFLTFRLIPGAGRGLPNARSYVALGVGALTGGVMTASLFHPSMNDFLALVVSNLVSILLMTPPVLLVATRWIPSWLCPLPKEQVPEVPFPQNLDLHGYGEDLNSRLLFYFLLIVGITSLVVPLARANPQVGGWPLLGYLGVVVWMAMDHGLRGGLLATCFSGTFYLAGRAYIDRDLLPDDPALYAMGLSADFVVFSVVAVVIGSGREEEVRLLRERERRELQLTRLTEMGDLLQASLSLDEAYRLLAQRLPTLFPQHSGSLAVLKDADLYEVTVVWGDPSNEEVFPGEECWAIRRGLPYRVEEISKSPRCSHLQKAAGTTFCVPLIAHGETLGILELHDPSHLPKAQQELALAVARQSALAFANIRLRDSLRQQSIRDPLTGLFNRRYMTETLQRETFRAQRSRQSFTLLVADIDHFKRFNDQYGHEAGDRVLQRVAQTLEEGARGEDIVCRWGGEEFVWVQFGADLESGERRAEEMLRSVRELELEYDGQPLPPITLSFGAAVFPQHGTTSEEVLRIADEALYRAKAEGRNRVVVAELPKEPSPPNLTLLSGGS